MKNMFKNAIAALVATAMMACGGSDNVGQTPGDHQAPPPVSTGDAGSMSDAMPDAKADTGSTTVDSSTTADTGSSVDSGSTVDAGPETSTDSGTTNDSGSDTVTTTLPLTIGLAANIVGQTVVKNAMNVPAIGIEFSNANDLDITVQSIALAGNATTAACPSLGTDCSFSEISNRLVSVLLIANNSQHGGTSSFDASGIANIPQFELTVPRHSSVIASVFVSLSSESVSPAGSQFTIGILDRVGWNKQVSAIDANGHSVSVLIVDDMDAQLSSGAAVVMTVRDHGDLTITADAMPFSNIIVAGRDAWYPFAQYKVTATYEEATMDRLAVLLGTTLQNGYFADNADFSEIAVAHNGMVLGSDVPSAAQPTPSGNLTKDVDFSGNGLVIPKDSSTVLQLWAKIPPVVPYALNAASVGVARSGHAPALGIMSNLDSGAWDSNYTGFLNVRATGRVSGDRLYAPEGAAVGNPMVIRKSNPIIVKQALATTLLQNTDQDLIKFQIASDSLGPISFMTFAFTGLKTGNFSVSDFRLRRGSIDLDPLDYTMSITTLSPTDSTFYLNVTMTREEVVQGSGNVYTVHASTQGATVGNSLTLNWNSADDQSVLTGGFVTTLGGSAAIFVNNYFHYTNFCWSDFSEVPHLSDYWVSTHPWPMSSVDWTNGYRVQDIAFSQTLSL